MSLRNLSPGTVAALLRPLPKRSVRAPEPLEGIYRSTQRVGGRPLWYALNWLGEPVALRVVAEGESEAQVVADLIAALRGDNARRPTFKVIRGNRRASSSDPSQRQLFPSLQLVKPAPPRRE